MQAHGNAAGSRRQSLYRFCFIATFDCAGGIDTDLWEIAMLMGIIGLFVVVLAMSGVAYLWPTISGWGYDAGGGAGVLFIALTVLMLLERV